MSSSKYKFLFPESKDTGEKLIKQTYIQRDVNVYGIHDYELDNLSFLNALSHTLFAVGSALVSIGITIYLNASFSEVPSPELKVLNNFVRPWCFYLSAVVYFLGSLTVWHRRKVINKIKKSSND